jgi:hypothetical protein
MDAEGLLTYSQEPATGTHPELKIRLNINQRPGLPLWVSWLTFEIYFFISHEFYYMSSPS